MIKDYTPLMFIPEKGCIALKGWNLDKNKIIDILQKNISSQVNILQITEDKYYISKYFEGIDAKLDGYEGWIFFIKKTHSRKNCGKSTQIDFEILEVKEK